MQVTPEEDWRRLLQGYDSSVVELLTNELEAIIQGAVKSDKGEAKHGKSKHSDYAEKGLKCKANGTWWVQVVRCIQTDAGMGVGMLRGRAT